MINEKQPLVAIDISAKNPESDAEGNYRVSDAMLAFIKNLESDHNVVGFAYDGTVNFKILLKKMKGKPERVTVTAPPKSSTGGAPTRSGAVRVKSRNPLK